MNELIMWLMTVTTLTLAFTLYIRVDIHDWGMVGLTTFTSGVSILLVRWVMRHYGWIDDSPVMVILWRMLVVIGAPLALTGFVMSFWRDKPPARQVLVRLSVLVLFIVVLTITVASV